MTTNPEDAAVTNEDVLGLATTQLEIEIGARQILARAHGLALVHLSQILEGDEVLISARVDPLGLVLIAFAARGRRVLRAAYRLLDEGDFPEAVPLLRVLLEYAIVARWLKDHPDRLGAWSLKDIERRVLTLDGILAELPQDFPGRDVIEGQRDEVVAFRDGLAARSGVTTGAIPPIEVMAAEGGVLFGYQLAYRPQSQSDVHANPLAVDASYEQQDDGMLRLRPRPLHSLAQFNQYEFGAYVLRDLLSLVSDHMPGFLWRTGLEGITAAMITSRESDPRKRLAGRWSRVRGRG
jgi:hypothetical protein